MMLKKVVSNRLICPHHTIRLECYRCAILNFSIRVANGTQRTAQRVMTA